MTDRKQKPDKTTRKYESEKTRKVIRVSTTTSEEQNESKEPFRRPVTERRGYSRAFIDHESGQVFGMVTQSDLEWAKKTRKELIVIRYLLPPTDDNGQRPVMADAIESLTFILEEILDRIGY